MIDKIIVFKQNSIKLNNIYIDPYGIDDYYNDAKYVFITHNHYDHWSQEDIAKVINDETIFIVPNSMRGEYGYKNDVIFVEPHNEYKVDELSFKTLPMYNIDKEFHQKKYNWCSYLITIDKLVYYVMGDTDDIPEIKDINCDVVFIPIGGTFTMTMDEAIECLNKINYKHVIPVHYGSIIGSKDLGIKFKDRIGDKAVIKIK